MREDPAEVGEDLEEGAVARVSKVVQAFGEFAGGVAAAMEEDDSVGVGVRDGGYDEEGAWCPHCVFGMDFLGGRWCFCKGLAGVSGGLTRG